MRNNSDGIAIVFGVLSCRSSAAAITQFAQAVSPHKVLVHHDFSQTSNFEIKSKNVLVVRDAGTTSWGSWTLVSATMKLIEEALALDQFDYFQLVSESCLPARPVSEFEEYLTNLRPDVMIDMQPIRYGTSAAVVNYAWRYLPRTPLQSRISRRSSQWWLGPHYTCDVAFGGILKIPGIANETRLQILKRRVGKSILKFLLWPKVGAFPLGKFTDCWVGGQWFGISRLAAERLLALHEESPALEAHFKRCHIPDESYIHTLVAEGAFPNVYPGNHVTFWDGGKYGPDQIMSSDLVRIRRSGKFFARKFTLDPECPVRQGMLSIVKLREPDGSASTTDQDTPGYRQP